MKSGAREYQAPVGVRAFPRERRTEAVVLALPRDLVRFERDDWAAMMRDRARGVIADWPIGLQKNLKQPSAVIVRRSELHRVTFAGCAAPTIGVQFDGDAFGIEISQTAANLVAVRAASRFDDRLLESDLRELLADRAPP